jgi:uncharacterized membrane protein YhaH (DUF805 family)
MKELSVVDYLFSFHGRCNRQQWWIGQLIILLPYLAATGMAEAVDASTQAKLIATLCLIPLGWIDLAISAKRYHDLGKSGLRQLLVLVPLIGTLWVVIELGFLRGSLYANRYGYPGAFGRPRIYFRGSREEGWRRAEPPPPQ